MNTSNIPEILGEEQIDDDECAICLDGNVTDDNEILYCDKCNIAVHQFCYDVYEVPKNEWYCQVCAKNLDPKELTCEVCPFKGGAYMQTQDGKWIHTLCANWIPEVFKPNKRYNISEIDASRYKLRCILCKGKGVKIQCAYGRCNTSAHPQCALKAGSGFTHRVVKNPSNEEGVMDWDIFCVAHATAVSAPVKPKIKAKRTTFLVIDDATPEDIDDVDNNTSKQSKQQNEISKFVTPKKSKKDSDEYYSEEEVAEFENTPRPKSGGKGKKNSDSKKSDVVNKKKEERRATGNTEGYTGGGTKSGGVHKLGSMDWDESYIHENNMENESASEIAAAPVHLVYHYSEWPGQSEECMDLHHLWNILSMCFPEDHTKEWFVSMYETLLLNEKNPYYTEYINDTVVPLGSIQKTYEGLLAGNDDVTEQLCSDKDIAVIADKDKFDLMISVVDKTISSLRGICPEEVSMTSNIRDEISRIDRSYCAATIDDVARTNDGVTEEDREESDRNNSAAHVDNGNVSSGHVDESSHAFELEVMTSQDIDQNMQIEEISTKLDKTHYVKYLVDYFTRKSSSSVKTDPSNFIGGKNGIDPTKLEDGTLRVVFNSNPRICCEYDVAANSTTATSTEIINQHLTTEYMYDEDINYLIFGSKVKPLMSTTEHIPQAELKLKTSVKIPNDVSVRVGEKYIISNDENDEISEMIYFLQNKLKAVLDSIESNIHPLITDVNTKSYSEEDILQRQNKQKKDYLVVKAYSQQKCWKKVCCGVLNGMKEQTPDFNKPMFDSIPASWKIKVIGRPIVAEANNTNKADEENETQEDTVCMCCFDGTSTDTNSILFCDGCNATLHMACYGISEIPEADFFCDRCQKIREYASDPNSEVDLYNYHNDLKDLISCCLCTLDHGGLKETTDGRWVHVCCALWCQDSIITDILSMKPIDISNVPVGSSIIRKRRQESILNLSTLDYQYSHHEKQAIAPVMMLLSNTSTTPSDCHTSINKSHDDETNTPTFQKCMFCGDTKGYVISCGYGVHEGDHIEKDSCMHFFHPLCAWFSGVYVTSSLTDSTYLGIERSGLFPSCVKFQFLCDTHIPIAEQVMNSHVGRDLQIMIRNKYRINVDDLNSIPGMKQIKRKKQKKKQASTAASSSAKRETKDKELPVDVYDDDICSACFEPFERLFPYKNEEKLLLFTSCVCCKVKIHRSCIPSLGAGRKQAKKSENAVNVEGDTGLFDASTVKEESVEIAFTEKSTDHLSIDVIPVSASHLDEGLLNGGDGVDVERSQSKPQEGNDSTNAPALDLEIWTCDNCLSNTVDESEETAIAKCALCPRRGGAIQQLPDGKYAHIYCSNHRPHPTKPITSLAADEISGGSSTSKKQACLFCHRRTGVVGRCSFPYCTAHFHPICGMHHGAFMRIRCGVKEQYCKDHIPRGSFYLQSKRIWLDMEDIKRLRTTLDKARIILDMIKKREKIKKFVYIEQYEFFRKKLTAVQTKIAKRKNSSSNELSGDGDNLLSPISKSPGSKKFKIVNKDTDEINVEDDDEEEFDMMSLLASGGMEENHAKGKKMPKISKKRKTIHSDEEEEMNFEPECDHDFFEGHSAAKRRGRPPKKNSTDSNKSTPFNAIATKVKYADFSENVDEEDEDVDDDIFFQIRKPPKKYTKEYGKKQDDNDLLTPYDECTTEDVKLLSNTWYRKGKLMIPNRFVVKFSGQEVEKGVLYNYSFEKDYKKFLNQEIVKTIDCTRDVTHIFATQRDAQEFSNKLQSSISLYCNESTSLVDLLDADSKGIPYTSSNKRKKTISESTNKKADFEEFPVESASCVDDLQATTKDKKEIMVKKKAKMSKFGYSNANMSILGVIDKYTTHNNALEDYNFEAFLFQNFSALQEYTNGSNDWVRMPSVESTKAPNTPSKSKSKKSSNSSSIPQNIEDLLPVNKQFLFRLERKIFLILNWLHEFEIPCMGVTPIVDIHKNNGVELFCEDMFKQIQLHGIQAYKHRLHGKKHDEQVLSSFSARSSPRIKREVSNSSTKSNNSVDSVPHFAKKSIWDREDSYRYLVEGFEDLPEEYPTYYEKIAIPLTINILKEKLQKHLYTSFASFANDFYRMLCNGRLITSKSSKTWWDTAVLSELFAFLRILVCIAHNPNSDLHSINTKQFMQNKYVDISSIDISTINMILQIDPPAITVCPMQDIKSTTAVQCCDITCSGCLIQYSVGGFPAAFEAITKEYSNDVKPSSSIAKKAKVSNATSSDWKWLCASCLNICSDLLVNREVKVWWTQDDIDYQGVISDYDDSCGSDYKEHRITYSDGEWAYVRLHEEACLISFPQEEFIAIHQHILESQNINDGAISISTTTTPKVKQRNQFSKK